MVSRFADTFERVVIRKRVNVRALEIASKAFHGSINAVSFRVERTPVPLGVKCSAADASNGPH